MTLDGAFLPCEHRFIGIDVLMMAVTCGDGFRACLLVNKIGLHYTVQASSVQWAVLNENIQYIHDIFIYAR